MKSMIKLTYGNIIEKNLHVHAKTTSQKKWVVAATITHRENDSILVCVLGSSTRKQYVVNPNINA